MGGKSTPEAPDYSALARSSERAANLAFQTSSEQLQWARERWDETQKILQPTLDAQLNLTATGLQRSGEDRQRYQDVYQPLEDNLIQEFQDFDTPERRRLESGRAQAQVGMALDKQREAAMQRLESYGIDPSQTRSAALDLGMRSQNAAMMAAAGNQQRDQIQSEGRGLRAEGINIGRGMPTQYAQQQALASGAANSALQGQIAGVGSGVQSMGTGTQWMGAGNQGINTAGNMQNMGFQNQLAQAQFEHASSPLTALGNIAGTAAGVYTGAKLAG